MAKYRVDFPAAKHGIAGDARVIEVGENIAATQNSDGSLYVITFVEAATPEDALRAGAQLYYKLHQFMNDPVDFDA